METLSTIQSQTLVAALLPLEHHEEPRPIHARRSLRDPESGQWLAKAALIRRKSSTPSARQLHCTGRVRQLCQRHVHGQPCLHGSRQITPAIQRHRQPRPRPGVAQKGQCSAGRCVAPQLTFIQQAAPTVAVPDDAEQADFRGDDVLGQHSIDFRSDEAWQFAPAVVTGWLSLCVSAVAMVNRWRSRTASAWPVSFRYAGAFARWAGSKGWKTF